MSLRDQVLSDFIDAWNGGRRPRAADHLRRVEPGPERDALAAELTLWLEIAAPPRSLDRDAVRRALTAGWPEALPRLRARAGYDLPALAGRLVDDLGLGDGAERAAAYLGEMEARDARPGQGLAPAARRPRPPARRHRGRARRPRGPAAASDAAVPRRGRRRRRPRRAAPGARPRRLHPPAARRARAPVRRRPRRLVAHERDRRLRLAHPPRRRVDRRGRRERARPARRRAARSAGAAAAPGPRTTRRPGCTR